MKSRVWMFGVLLMFLVIALLGVSPSVAQSSYGSYGSWAYAAVPVTTVWTVPVWGGGSYGSLGYVVGPTYRQWRVADRTVRINTRLAAPRLWGPVPRVRYHALVPGVAYEAPTWPSGPSGGAPIPTPETSQ